jgi:hypothetical protein
MAETGAEVRRGGNTRLKLAPSIVVTGRISEVPTTVRDHRLPGRQRTRAVARALNSRLGADARGADLFPGPDLFASTGTSLTGVSVRGD